MPSYSIKKILKTINESFSSIKKDELKICLLGLSFKNNTGDCRFTPTIPVVESLLSEGYSIFAYDKFISEEDFKLFKNLNRSWSINEALSDSQVVIFLCGHDEFKNISIDQLKKLLKPNAFIYDGRMYFNKKTIKDFKNANFIFKGVGR